MARRSPLPTATCLLRRLRGGQPDDDHLRDAATAGPCAVQPAAEHRVVLDDYRRRHPDVAGADLRRHSSDTPRAGDGHEYMDVQQQLALFYWIRLTGGAVTMVGFVLYLVAIL